MKELVTSLAFTHFHLPQFARSSQDFAKSKLEIVCKLPWRSPLKNQLSLYTGQESKYPSLELTPVGPFPLIMASSTKFHY